MMKNRGYIRTYGFKTSRLKPASSALLHDTKTKVGKARVRGPRKLAYETSCIVSRAKPTDMSLSQIRRDKKMVELLLKDETTTCSEKPSFSPFHHIDYRFFF